MGSTNNSDFLRSISEICYPLETNFDITGQNGKGKNRGHPVVSFSDLNMLYLNKSSAASSTTSSEDTSDRAESIESDDAEDFRTGIPRITLDGQMKAPPVTSTTPTQEVNENAFETKEYLPKEKVESMKNLLRSRKKDPLLPNNTRALSKDSLTYELEKFEKHALLIFNQKNINGYKPRLGTEKDVEELKETFSSFGFDVMVENDLTKEEIMQKLQEFSDQDYTDYGCVAVAVLTHGSKHGLIRAKDQQYSELEIIKHLKVDTRPTLITKPKIVIIQASGGSEEIEDDDVHQAMDKIKKDDDQGFNKKLYTPPLESDLFIVHSSYIGKPSYRDDLHGSWFIQSLCRKINQLAATHDLGSIMTEVKRDVAIQKFYEVYNSKSNGGG